MGCLLFIVYVLTVAPWSLAAPVPIVDLNDADVAFSPANMIAPLGDVNGDGHQDALLRLNCTSESPREDLFVALGPIQEGDHRLPGDPIPGFEVQLTDPTHNSTCIIASTAVGDVNGDGLDDVVIGAPFADRGRGGLQGAVYIVFGKTDTDKVELATFDQGTQGDAGYVIVGPSSVSLLGHYMAGLGDVNGDGLADMAFGSPFLGRTYVVFGQSSTDKQDLLSFESGDQGDAGFVIRTRGTDNSGDSYSVGAAGDVNADGIPDIVIGSIGRVNHSVGRAYVVFGKLDPVPIDARHLKGTGLGFKITTLHPGDSGGQAVSGAGDVNGDGRDDVLVGVPRGTLGCCRGLAFVVFGKGRSRPVELAELRGKGFRIRGAHDNDHAGNALATVGDVNGDGLSDLLVGARLDDVEGRGKPGAVYLVYGKADTEPIRLRKLTSEQGVRFIGRESGDRTGWMVAGPGDMNGDGIPDIMISSVTGGYSDIVWGLSWEE